MTSSNSKSKQVFVSDFVQTGKFSKEKMVNLIEMHQMMCKTLNPNKCKTTCDGQIPETSAPNSDFLIVGTTLS